MPMKLTRTADPAITFAGKTGESFTVDVVPAAGGGPFLIHSICYGDTCAVAAPFTFTIVAGSKALVAVYDWDKDGAFVELRETDGADSQTLRKRRYREEEPFQSVMVKGI